MKVGKNSVTITLIISSISLLLVLQVLWLRSAYQAELHRIEKETNDLFRNTVFALSDSLMQKNMRTLPNVGFSKRAQIQFHDSIKVFATTKNSDVRTLKKDTANNVQVFIYSQTGKDSINDILKPLANRIRNSKGPKTFSFQLNGEKLDLKEVEKEFQEALEKENISIPFKVIAVKREFDFPLRVPRLKDDRIIFTPVGGFKTEFADMKWFVLRRITPQVFFSLFLTTLTIVSFWFLLRSIRSQQRLAELKNDFISNMTHELKTPVTTVGVAIEALKNFNGLENKELTHEYLTIAQNELNRLSLLTDKILKTAIFENKGIDFQPETVDLEKIIEQVLSSMKLLVEKQKAAISFEKTGSDFQFQGCHVHLSNVVYNLLDNALKYSRKNPKIDISLKEIGKELILSVKDNGVGISSEYKKKVFEKFFRVPTGDVHNSKGYGLGLSYVDSVVKAHKGTIVVESELGEGSKFIIRLTNQHSTFKI